MQNDDEIARQLEALWKMISDGITRANKVLEQAKEIELDVSAAEKAKAEIAAVIGVEISRAIGEVQPEISRVETAKAEIAEVITRANNVIQQAEEVNTRLATAKAEITEVMEVDISRAETAKSEVQLEISRLATAKAEIAAVIGVEISRAKSEVQPEISRVEKAKAEIAEVITRANNMIQQAEEVNIGLATAKAEITEVMEVDISRAKSEAQTQLAEIRELTKQNESTYNESLQEKLELNERYTSFESLIKEIGGSAGLKELRRELQEGRDVAFKLERYHHQENHKLLLKTMEQQQQQLIRQGKLAILIVSVWTLLISLIK